MQFFEYLSYVFLLLFIGKVYAWGIGSNNQLGAGSEDDVYEPVLLTGAQIKNKEVLNVNSGGQHTLFLVSETEVVQEADSTTKTTKKTEPDQPQVNGTTEKDKTVNDKASKPAKKAATKKK